MIFKLQRPSDLDDCFDFVYIYLPYRFVSMDYHRGVLIGKTFPGPPLDQYLAENADQCHPRRVPDRERLELSSFLKGRTRCVPFVPVILRRFDASLQKPSLSKRSLRRLVRITKSYMVLSDSFAHEYIHVRVTFMMILCKLSKWVGGTQTSWLSFYSKSGLGVLHFIEVLNIYLYCKCL